MDAAHKYFSLRIILDQYSYWFFFDHIVRYLKQKRINGASLFLPDAPPPMGALTLPAAAIIFKSFEFSIWFCSLASIIFATRKVVECSVTPSHAEVEEAGIWPLLLAARGLLFLRAPVEEEQEEG